MLANFLQSITANRCQEIFQTILISQRYFKLSSGRHWEKLIVIRALSAAHSTEQDSKIHTHTNTQLQ